MKPPPLTKVRKQWLAALRDGAEHEVALFHSLGPGTSATLRVHMERAVVRLWSGDEHLCEVRTGLNRPYKGAEFGKRGIQRGGPSWSKWIEPLTDEHRRVLHLRRLREKVKRAEWAKATDDQILRIAEVLGLTDAS